MGWDRIIGEGGGNLSEERFPPPSPNPTPLPPKTFVFWIGEAQSVFRMMTL